MAQCPSLVGTPLTGAKASPGLEPSAASCVCVVVPLSQPRRVCSEAMARALRGPQGPLAQPATRRGGWTCWAIFCCRSSLPSRRSTSSWRSRTCRLSSTRVPSTAR